MLGIISVNGQHQLQSEQQGVGPRRRMSSGRIRRRSSGQPGGCGLASCPRGALQWVRVKGVPTEASGEVGMNEGRRRGRWEVRSRSSCGALRCAPCQFNVERCWTYGSRSCARRPLSEGAAPLDASRALLAGGLPGLQWGF